MSGARLLRSVFPTTFAECELIRDVLQKKMNADIHCTHVNENCSLCVHSSSYPALCVARCYMCIGFVRLHCFPSAGTLQLHVSSFACQKCNCDESAVAIFCWILESDSRLLHGLEGACYSSISTAMNINHISSSETSLN